MKKISILRQLWCPSMKVASYDTIAETKMTYGYFSNLKTRSNIFQQSIKRKLLSWRLLLSRVTQCANKPTFKFYHRACQTIKCNLGVKNNANIYIPKFKWQQGDSNPQPYISLLNTEQCSQTIWPVWLNGWMFVYEVSDCGFESRCHS